jgi:beta-1,4-mannosyl-glycoprotein beta-1,4-N-acetylglucosaminyltransferase
MLSFRLKELNNVVDYFVLVESTVSHSGKVKELIYQNNKHLFEEYNHKIIHVVVDDTPEGDYVSHAWVKEEFQRNSIVRGVSMLNLNEDDLIIISDCDEIPNTDLLKQIKLHNGLNIFKDENNKKYLNPPLQNTEVYDEGSVGLLQDLYYYNLECRYNGIWWQARILTYQKLKELKDPEYIRRSDFNHRYYRNAGWHFSYFFDVDGIITKIQNFTHQEYNNEEYLDKSKLQYLIDNNKDLYNRDFVELIHIPISENQFLPYNYKMLQ